MFYKLKIMKNLEILLSPSPATEPAPTIEPGTKPTEPNTNPNTSPDNDPWNVPAPDVEPTPKA